MAEDYSTNGLLRQIKTNTGSAPSGTATAANQTAPQADPGSDATKAVAVQGVTGGKAVPVSAASLPLPSGAATAAKQPALGSAGTASTDVITVQGIASATPIVVGGAVAHLGSNSGNPVKVGAVYNAATPAPSSGQIVDLQTDTRANLRVTLVDFNNTSGANIAAINADSVAVASTNGLAARGFVYGYNGTSWDRLRGDTGGLVTQPYALTGSRWNYAAASGGITNTTTAVTIAAAAGASLRNYVTSIQIDAEALGAATEVAIRDGAGGAVLWRMKIGTGGLTGGRDIVFPVPLKGTANTLLEVVTLTASVTGAVFFNAQGYTAA